MTDHHDNSVDGARAAADADDLDAWVRTFLGSPGSDNAELGDQLDDKVRWWAGPMKLPLDQMNRLAGPAGHPVIEVVEEDYWRDDVGEMAEKIANGWEPPPVVIVHRDDQLVLEDGNHRVEALRQASFDEAWSIVGFETEDDRAAFREQYPDEATDAAV
ncbi:MAG: hypothetical protein ACXIVQ_09710 [Acidimicrobiales bacterium]